MILGQSVRDLSILQRSAQNLDSLYLQKGDFRAAYDVTVGLVSLFIALVMMGWLAVPPAVIRALGFLSFIFLFEFIILLADKTIQAWTHEEPWKVLLIKIWLAAEA